MPAERGARRQGLPVIIKYLIARANQL